MAENSAIAWTTHTMNPWIGCTKVSPGCTHCYAEALMDTRWGKVEWGANGTRQVTSPTNWKLPLKWDREARKTGERPRVFCASLCDVLEDRPDLVDPRVRLFRLIRDTPALDWLLLTKRPENYRPMLARVQWMLDMDNVFGSHPDPAKIEAWPNVWIGTSIESNDYVGRADYLRAVPATVRFISYEPALGPLDKLDLTGIDWVIQGGESGSGYRPMDKQWARDMKARCEAEGVAYFFKQSAAPRTEMGVELDGEIVRNYPLRRLPLPVLGGGAP